MRLLETAVRTGTGRTAALPVATYGKTGTTQNYRDALFVGFAGDLVVGVWVGNDDNTPMNGVTGRTLPADIWKAFMEAALPLDDMPRAEPVENEIDVAREVLRGLIDEDAVIEDAQAAIDAATEALDAMDAPDGPPPPPVDEPFVEEPSPVEEPFDGGG